MFFQNARKYIIFLRYLCDNLNKKKKMAREILISNDDSINAKGLEVLIRLMRAFGNVTVVAPTEPQSAKSASISLGSSGLVLRKVKEEEGLRLYSLNGTPVDCIKAAFNCLYPEGTQPDLIVSGINHGSNASSAVHYSGTVAAVTEAAISLVPGIAYSICSHIDNPDFSALEHWIPIITQKLIDSGLHSDTFYPINFPALPLDELKGIKLTRRGRGRWIHEYQIGEQTDDSVPLTMTGKFLDLETGSTDPIPADHPLLEQGYITITPIQIDHTDYKEISRLSHSF